MHHAFLLALLGIPLLIAMHVALFWQPIPWRADTFRIAAVDHAHSRGSANSPDPALHSRFVIVQTTEQGP